MKSFQLKIALSDQSGLELYGVYKLVFGQLHSCSEQFKGAKMLIIQIEEKICFLKGKFQKILHCSLLRLVNSER